MKTNLLKQLLKSTAAALACAVIVIGNPVPTPSDPGSTGNGQNIEIPGTGDNDEDPGISPQNDKGDEYDIVSKLD